MSGIRTTSTSYVRVLEESKQEDETPYPTSTTDVIGDGP